MSLLNVFSCDLLKLPIHHYGKSSLVVVASIQMLALSKANYPTMLYGYFGNIHDPTGEVAVA